MVELQNIMQEQQVVFLNPGRSQWYNSWSCSPFLHQQICCFEVIIAIDNQLNKVQVFVKDFQVDVVTVGIYFTEDCPVGFGLKSPAPMCSLSMCEWRGGEAVGA